MSGDSGRVRAGANAYSSAAAEIHSIVNGLNATVASIVGPSWRGQGAAGFGSSWNQTGSEMDQLGNVLSDFANQLNQVAGKIDHINTMEEVLHGLEIAAAVGVGLTIFTLGISDAEAAAAAAEAVVVEGEIELASAALDEAVATGLEAILSSASRILLTFATRFAGGAAMWGGGTAIQELVFTGHIDWGTVLNNAIAGGIAQGLIPAKGILTAATARGLFLQGWVEGTLASSMQEAETHGTNPLAWNWTSIDLNALETGTGNLASRVGFDYAASVVAPHIPAAVVARVPQLGQGSFYVGQHRAQ